MSRNTITKILQKMGTTIKSPYTSDLNGWYLLTSWSEKQKYREYTFILKALLKPLAKKPPKGAIIEANKPRHKACHWIGRIDISFQANCARQHIVCVCVTDYDFQIFQEYELAFMITVVIYYKLKWNMTIKSLTFS